MVDFSNKIVPTNVSHKSPLSLCRMILTAYTSHCRSHMTLILLLDPCPLRKLEGRSTKGLIPSTTSASMPLPLPFKKGKDHKGKKGYIVLLSPPHRPNQSMSFTSITSTYASLPSLSFDFGHPCLVKPHPRMLLPFLAFFGSMV